MLLNRLNFCINGIFVQRVGNTIASPTMISTTPEKLVQDACGISINKVVAFKRSVNTITDTESEVITVIARFDMPIFEMPFCAASIFEEPCPPTSEDPITIGSKGNIHGASTVNIPAKIDIRKKIMLCIVEMSDFHAFATATVR